MYMDHSWAIRIGCQWERILSLGDVSSLKWQHKSSGAIMYRKHVYGKRAIGWLAPCIGCSHRLRWAEWRLQNMMNGIKDEMWKGFCCTRTQWTYWRVYIKMSHSSSYQLTRISHEQSGHSSNVRNVLTLPAIECLMQGMYAAGKDRQSLWSWINIDLQSASGMIRRDYGAIALHIDHRTDGLPSTFSYFTWP